MQLLVDNQLLLVRASESPALHLCLVLGLHLLNLVHDLFCDWVVDAVEALTDLFIDTSIAFLQALQVLVRDVCMTVGARDPTITVSFDEERADVGSVPLGSFRAT